MERDGFLGGVGVILCVETFCEPDIEEINDVVDRPVARLNITVENFREIGDFVVQIRRSDGAVDSWLVGLVEGSLRRHVEVVFDPETDAFVLDSNFFVEGLQQSNVGLVAPHEEVCVWLGDSFRVFDA